MHQVFRQMRTESTKKSITTALAVSLLFAFLINACTIVPGLSLPTPTPSPTATVTPTSTPTPLPEGYVEYVSQSGDTLEVIARHFGVGVGQIIDISDRRSSLMIDPGTHFLVKDTLGETTRPDILFPDSAIVYSPVAVQFDPVVFTEKQTGFIKTYTETMTRGATSAAQIIFELGRDYSINPQILLAFMEYESGWLSNPKPTGDQLSYPMGWKKSDRTSVYFQTGWVIKQLTRGYYLWRIGTLTELAFPDGSTLRLSPRLNAGTVAVMYALAQIHNRAEWEQALYGEHNIVSVHTQYFGDAFEYGKGVAPLFPAGLQQPELNLPFPVNEVWNLTGGPHTAWGSGWDNDGSLAALDFAPPLSSPGCGNSTHYATAMAAGRVVRAGGGVVVLDLDMDGYEQTGWVLVYMHIANSDRVQVNDILAEDDLIGHPSCEGGSSSGIHVHVARKYNGEWVEADGGLPFVMSGNRAHNGEDYYEGTLENGATTVVANTAGNYWTRIIRPESREEFFYTPTPRK